MQITWLGTERALKGKNTWSGRCCKARKYLTTKKNFEVRRRNSFGWTLRFLKEDSESGGGKILWLTWYNDERLGNDEDSVEDTRNCKSRLTSGEEVSCVATWGKKMLGTVDMNQWEGGWERQWDIKNVLKTKIYSHRIGYFWTQKLS